ncbi:hypothetical protein RRG08_027567 [Elysia crispata]|uniref:Uncharacterized protein n=1 Tax=Elysia crispata TaxID=231223 RepID=A0AAE1AF11_9GAST|nr:hypothetical protein RRG08_027567 [Elysia crispata]
MDSRLSSGHCGPHLSCFDNGPSSPLASVSFLHDSSPQPSHWCVLSKVETHPACPVSGERRFGCNIGIPHHQQLTVPQPSLWACPHGLIALSPQHSCSLPSSGRPVWDSNSNSPHKVCGRD